MAKGFKHGAGGGGAGLNFLVVGGTTAPSSPKENTIWVNTGNAITGWVFSATEPEAPVEGMVWISTGSASSAEFNALKKNGIQVYPISAKQYVSGKWVSKTAKSYHGGKWVGWMVYLVNNGTPTTDFLNAGYTQLKDTYNGSTVTFTSTEVKMSSNGETTHECQFDFKFDASVRNAVRITGKTQAAYSDLSNATKNTVTLYVVNDTGSMVASASITTTKKGSYETFDTTIDISNVTAKNAKICCRCVRDGNYSATTILENIMLL